MDRAFKIKSDLRPTGDQPQAIEQLVNGLRSGLPHQVLLGVTGSGKTFTMANIIERVDRPALILAHNKVLAAQLYREFKELFPDNAVDYFVSYYDYYQPEAYLPQTDTYIEKDCSINDELEKMRLSATKNLLERRDVIIVSSVSCIYGLGTREDWQTMIISLKEGMKVTLKEVIRDLVFIQYERGDIDFHRSTFRTRGDILDIFPAYEETFAVRIEFFGDEIESIWEFDALTGKKTRRLGETHIYPSSHYVTTHDKLQIAIHSIEDELCERLQQLRAENKMLEYQRLNQRTQYDLELLQEMGHCRGIENYSRHLAGRKAGDPPETLIDYFPKDFLLFVDESHVTMPQIHAMYEGDHSRKSVLVEHGFRLPSALDNRPLKFEEFEARTHQTIYVSATPGEWELKKSEGIVAEQIIRPTGLVDPEIAVKPATGQVEDALEEIRIRVKRNERVLITTLTKRMAEDLTGYLVELGVKAKYMHADTTAIDRAQLIKELRQGVFDILVGINLLREGLDIPEVSLVLILDADKEGFLRGRTALIQTIGRASRNVNGRVVLYADRETQAIKEAIAESTRRRNIQKQYNEKHGITPQTVVKKVGDILDVTPSEPYEESIAAETEALYGKSPLLVDDPEDLKARISFLRGEMRTAAAKLEFEKAAGLRDKIKELELALLGLVPKTGTN